MANRVLVLVVTLLSIASATTLFKKPNHVHRGHLNPTNLQGGRHPRVKQHVSDTLTLEVEGSSGEAGPNPNPAPVQVPEPVPVQPQPVVPQPVQQQPAPSVKLRPRVGLEMELGGTTMILYKADAVVGAKLAPIQYSQTIFQSETNALGDTPYFAATIDGEKLTQYRYDVKKQEDVSVNTVEEHIIQGYFNTHFKPIWDGSDGAAGAFGLIELVSGPMELAAIAGNDNANDQEHKDLQTAMTEFMKALLAVQACTGVQPAKIDVPYYATKEAVPFEAVLTQYHAALTAKNAPDRFNKFKLTKPGTYPKPDNAEAIPNPPGYSWYVQCTDKKPARNLQVNFGYPLANFGLIPGGQSKDMTAYMTQVATNNLNKMRTAAKTLLGAQAQTNDPAVKDHKDTRGVMTLFMLVALNRFRYNHQLDQKPTARKDLYQFLPKVSWGQLRDKLPDTQKTALTTFLQLGTAADTIVAAIIAAAPTVPAQAPAWVRPGGESGTDKLKAIVTDMLASPNEGGVSAGLYKLVAPFYLDNDPTKLTQAFVMESRQSDCVLNQRFFAPFDVPLDPAAGLAILRELTSDMQNAT